MFASVVVDIPTRALSTAFDYAVPEQLEHSCQVGTTVLVPFSGRRCVGYVIDLLDQPPAGISPDAIKSIERILAPAAFDEKAVELAFWMSDEYAASISECLRLFIAPGQTLKMVRDSSSGAWELQGAADAAVDARWVRLRTDEAAQNFVPRANAARQRMIIQALQQGPLRVSELTATLGSSSATLKTLASKGVVDIYTKRQIRDLADTSLSSAVALAPKQLTDEQQHALDTIRAARARACGDVVLIDGVTGSGKTEVYLNAISEVLEQGREAIVLVPEISLTAQTVGRFRSRFGEKVCVLHSRLSVGERYDQWDMLRRGVAQVVVGARSALFAPLANLGLIVIDEEHEYSYKQDTSPRYHAREVAQRLAQLHGAALVLGSATPSLESLARTQCGSFADSHWERVCMSSRPGTICMPQVQIVDMTEQFAAGHRSIFSEPLTQALHEVVARKQKAVLMLNRRGFANFLMCRECGCVPSCSHCSTSLTYHERTHALMCHSCGRSWSIRAWPDPSTHCPNCGSRYLAQFGVGTQRVEDELRILLGGEACSAAEKGSTAEKPAPAEKGAPNSTVASAVDIIRMDADTTKTKDGHQRLLEAFDASPCAVLIGTQMIAKGLDFPEVTLVGVINADTTLKLPDFRAAERSYSLLEQVAGRAGRGVCAGRVIIQSYWASHPAIQAVCTHNRAAFIRQELQDRKEAYYPPYARLSNVIVWGSNQAQVRQAVEKLACSIRQELEGREGWVLLGPADCVKSRVQDRYRMHVVLKSPLDSEPAALLSDCVAQVAQSSVGAPTSGGAGAKADARSDARPGARSATKTGIRMAIDVDTYDLL